MSAPRLAVLLATYDGGAWIAAQLDSLAAQTRQPDLVLVSDDGSKDGTRDLIDAFAVQNPDLAVRQLDGPGQGAAANFLSLIRRCPADVTHMAFADQDDVWLPAKLERAMAHLEQAEATMGADVPLLYCARILICDQTLTHRRINRGPRRATGFRNALTQNVATGNTIVLNAAATTLARQAAARTDRLIVHDWWLYQLVTGAGGHVVFDDEPQTLYRQHSGNMIGANSGLVARLRRVRQLLSGVYTEWNDANIAALRAASDLLHPDNAALVEAFAALRRRKAFGRLAGLRRLGLYRQGLAGQVSLLVAAFLGKI